MADRSYVNELENDETKEKRVWKETSDEKGCWNKLGNPDVIPSFALAKNVWNRCDERIGTEKKEKKKNEKRKVKEKIEKP